MGKQAIIKNLKTTLAKPGMNPNARKGLEKRLNSVQNGTSIKK